MTREEAAEKLGIDVDEVQRMLQSGRLRTEGEGIDPISVLKVMTDQLADLNLKMTATDQQPFLVAVGVPILLVLFLLFFFVFLFSAADANPIVPPLALIPISAVWIGSTAALARWGGGLGTMNGMGVTLVGRRAHPQGRIATAWVTLLFIPLVPLRSYVVLHEVEHERTMQGGATSYRLAPAAFCWPQVLPILLGVWAALIALTVWFVLG